MKEKVIREDFGFECRYYPTIMDGPVFRWSNGGIEVNASRNSVGINGNINFGMGFGIEDFGELLLLAKRTHDQLFDNRNKPDNDGGIWFREVFWPWGWVTGGKP